MFAGCVSSAVHGMLTISVCGFEYLTTMYEGVGDQALVARNPPNTATIAHISTSYMMMDFLLFILPFDFDLMFLGKLLVSFLYPSPSIFLLLLPSLSLSLHKTSYTVLSYLFLFIYFFILSLQSTTSSRSFASRPRSFTAGAPSSSSRSSFTGSSPVPSTTSSSRPNRSKTTHRRPTESSRRSRRPIPFSTCLFGRCSCP